MRFGSAGLVLVGLLTGCPASLASDSAIVHNHKDHGFVTIKHSNLKLRIYEEGDCSLSVDGYVIYDYNCDGLVDLVIQPGLEVPVNYIFENERSGEEWTSPPIIDNSALRRTGLSPEQLKHLDEIMVHYENKFDAQDYVNRLNE